MKKRKKGLVLAFENGAPQQRVESFDILLDVQRCSKCGQDRLPVVVDLDGPSEKKVCSWCGAENSFRSA